MDKLLKVSSNPHIRSKATTGRIMSCVVIALLPAAGFGVYNFGLNALVLILVSVASAVLTELIYELILKKKITIGDMSAVVTGLLLGLNLPSTAPWWIALIGGVFAILVVKMLFGGLGQNFMNPALGARCFLLLSFTRIMTDFPIMGDGVSSATPLAALKAGSPVNILSMVVGTTSGTIGETSMIAIAIGACFLIIMGVIDLRVPGSYIVSFVLFLMIFSGHGWDPAYISAHLAGGGLMLGAFFMATDYTTRPITKIGQYVFGIFLGIMTGIFRLFGPSAEGVSYAIILGNLIVPLIEKITYPKAFGRGAYMKDGIKDALILFAITVIAGVLLGAVYEITKEPIAYQQDLAVVKACSEVFDEAEIYQTTDEFESDGPTSVVLTMYPGEEITDCMEALSADEELLGYIITVTTHEGYGGDITLMMGVTLDGNLNGISILSISETAGLGMQAGDVLVPQFENRKVTSFSYTKNGATADNEIDAISGATITTNAVVNAVNAGMYYFYNGIGGMQ